MSDTTKEQAVKNSRRREVLDAFAIVREVSAWSLTYHPTWDEYRAMVMRCRDLLERLDRP